MIFYTIRENDKTIEDINPISDDKSNDIVYPVLEMETGDDSIVYETYISEQYDFQIDYPEYYYILEWVMGSVVSFSSKKDGENDWFRESINIIVQDLWGSKITLEEYYTLSSWELEKFITDMEIVSTSETILWGQSGYEIVFTWRQWQYNLKRKQKFMIFDNTAYIVTYTAQWEGYHKYINIFDKIFDSFKVL